MGRGLEFLKNLQRDQPSLGAEIQAMTRELFKDVRGTLHQTFFGQPEHVAEAGTPLNPTQQLITQSLTEKEVHPQQDRIVQKQREPER